MTTAAAPPTDAELLAWDWRAELRAQGRTIVWLAGRTGRPQNTVYAWAYGNRSAALPWLRLAYAELMGVHS